MSEPGSARSRGKGWVVLIAIPPVIVVVGLVAFFVWQVRKGTITPKWKPKTVMTNQAPEAGSPR